LEENGVYISSPNIYANSFIIGNVTPFTLNSSVAITTTGNIFVGGIVYPSASGYSLILKATGPSAQVTLSGVVGHNNRSISPTQITLLSVTAHDISWAGTGFYSTGIGSVIMNATNQLTFTETSYLCNSHTYNGLIFSFTKPLPVNLTGPSLSSTGVYFPTNSTITLGDKTSLAITTSDNPLTFGTILGGYNGSTPTSNLTVNAGLGGCTFTAIGSSTNQFKSVVIDGTGTFTPQPTSSNVNTSPAFAGINQTPVILSTGTAALEYNTAVQFTGDVTLTCNQDVVFNQPVISTGSSLGINLRIIGTGSVTFNGAVGSGSKPISINSDINTILNAPVRGDS
ncbi:MAG: hypothetical protein EB127_32115, partial [Alphaproteobacteria bacterium]|nr:hypothetical protein [Alphaproteobacteria bacterium]